ncbi:MAG: pyridoxal 5'-phosphate synthase glutaminase subunit PdxT [Candidatus Aenigmarchaeota archaeon]|nr:pyridoxal 5'-phosphate synthase glutaminase subunit PdxT [Candidatus Aenigmarchaeota archaeon]
MKIGVVAVQGAVSEHVEALNKAMEELKIDEKAVYVRDVKDLNDISGIVIPGGESTTINRLMLTTGMHERIIELSEEGLPILGTCAGAILLAKEGDEQIKQTNTVLLGLMDMKVLRNAYGRQVDSFEADVKIPEIGNKPFRAVFIRAPVIERVWGNTKVWAKHKNTIIGVKKENILALTFHPELTNDLRIHKYFIKMVMK